MELNEEDLKIVKSVMEQEIVYYVDEEFKYVSYPGVRPYMYAVSQYGNIVSIPSKRIKSTFDRKGYEAVELAGVNLGSKIKVSVHRLVAWEFVDGYDEENEMVIVNHKDSCTHHNYATNLEWCTISQNVYHALNNDNTYFAQRKFNKNDAKDICQMYENGYTVKQVFKLYTGFDISNQDKSTWVTLKNIYDRKTYKNISKRYNW